MTKGFIYTFILAIYAFSVLGGFGYAVYYKVYESAFSVLALGGMAFPYIRGVWCKWREAE